MKMKKLLTIILLAFLSITIKAQSPSTTVGTQTSYQKNRGSYSVDSIFAIPYRDFTPIYPSTIVTVGRVQISNIDDRFYYHDSANWKKLLIDTDTINKWKPINYVPTNTEVTNALGYTPYNSSNPNNYINSLSGFTTTNLTEGSNLYWTTARFNSSFGSKTTTDLGEGTNLYYTNTRARNSISVTASGNGDASYNSYTGVINIPRNTLYYNSSGVINQIIKKWTGTITASTASGQTVDISSASFGTILSVNVLGVQNVSTVKGAIVVGKSVSTSSLAFNIYSSKNTGVLLGGNIEGLEFHPSPSSVTLYVEVTGY